MRILALETSSPLGSVALIGADGIHQQSFSSAHRHSSELVPAVGKLLAKAKLRAEQVDLWAVGLGPGSFLGIRSSIAAAKGFALATGKPVVGVPSFDALAGNLPDHAGCDDIAVVSHAGRSEMYFGLYSRGRKTILELLQPADLRWRIRRRTYFAGWELQRFAEEIRQAVGDRAVIAGEEYYPSALVLARQAKTKFQEQSKGDETLEPIYLRETKFVKVAHSPPIP